MTQSHKSTTLPIKNRVLAADGHTAFLAHYDLGPQDVLQGLEPIGEANAAVFDTTWFNPKAPQYIIRDNITMTAWVYPTALPSNGDRGCLFINKSGYYFTIDTSLKLATHWYGKSSPGYHSSNGTCPMNSWTHVAVVWDDVGTKLYINGVLDKSVASTGTGAGVDVLAIGSEFINSRHFKGKINHLGLWGVAKSEEEIKRIMYYGVSGQEENLRGFWRMNEGEGSILRDSSPFQGDVTNEPDKTFAWDSGSQSFTMRLQEGRFGGAIAVEEETTNLILNPNFLSGVNASASITGLQVYEGVVGGTSTKILKMQYTGTGDGNISLAMDLADYAPSSTYTMSFYVKADEAVDLYNTNMIHYYTTAWKSISWNPDSLPTSWTKVTVTGTTLAETATSWRMILRPPNVANVNIYYAFPQIEQKSFATSFVDGTREVGRLDYAQNAIDLNEGTISVWFKPSSGFFSSSSWNRIVGHSTAGNTNEIELMRSSTSNKVAFAISNSSGAPAVGWNAVESTTSLVSDTWYNIACTWSKSSGETKLFINGILESYLSGILPSAFPSIFGTIGVGYHQNYGRRMNGLIDELRIDNVARSEEEIMAWYQSNSPFWPRGIYRKSY